jgi:hypothetical protein
VRKKRKGKQGEGEDKKKEKNKVVCVRMCIKGGEKDKNEDMRKRK